VYKRILHPTDFSSASRRALARAVQMAKSDRSQLWIVHVMAPPLPIVSDGYVSVRSYEDVLSSARKWGQKQLDRTVARATSAGARVRGVLREGVAAEQILKAARGAHADLIVMGTHGRTGLSRFVLGSVASRVVAGASCPVLTVRGSQHRRSR